MNKEQIRLAIDVGGTFTDFVAATTDGSRLWTFKLPSNPQHPASVIEQGVERLGPDARVVALHHGTTLATNAILQDRLARTALISTEGFSDTLAIARQSRDHLYRMDLPPRPVPPIAPSHRLDVHERILADGSVEIPLTDAAIDAVVATLCELNVDAVAVSLINSYVNPVHEVRLGERLRQHFPYVSLSHEVNAEFREFERTSTVVANAAMMPLINTYLDELDAVCMRQGINVLRLVQSNGGMMGTGTARGMPLSLVLSGPAAGVAATTQLIHDAGATDVITLDIGGTSTDVALIANATPARIQQRRIGPFTLRFPSLAVESVGAGGGSVVWLDAVGALKVGPHSAGANPGPACYGLGGTDPTVTDAQVILGFLPEHDTGGFRGDLRRDLAEQALQPVADRLGMTLRDLAWGVMEVASAHMVRAIRLISIEKGHDPRGFALVAYGGGGPVHAGRVAQHLGIPTVVVPQLASVFSSYGCLVSDIRYESARTFRRRLTELDSSQLGRQLAEIERELSRNLTVDQVDASDVRTARSIGLRYVGQNEEIVVDVDGAEPEIETIHAAFQLAHRARFHYVTDEPLETTSLSVSIIVPSATAGQILAASASLRKPSSTERTVFLGEGEPVRVPVLTRADVPTESTVVGPCLIEDEMTTIVVYPGQSARRDANGAIWMVADDKR